MIPAAIIEAIVEAATKAITGGTPAEDIIAAIEGAQEKTSRAALKEELDAAEKRKET